MGKTENPSTINLNKRSSTNEPIVALFLMDKYWTKYTGSWSQLSENTEQSYEKSKTDGRTDSNDIKELCVQMAESVVSTNFSHE